MASQTLPPHPRSSPTRKEDKEEEEEEVALFFKKKKNSSIRRNTNTNKKNKRKKTNEEEEEEEEDDIDDVSVRVQKAKERLNERQEMSKVGQSKGVDSELLLLGDTKEREAKARERELLLKEQQEKKERSGGGEVQLAFGAGAKGGLTIMQNENNSNYNEDPQMQLYVEEELEKRRREREEAQQQKDGDGEDERERNEGGDRGDFHSLQKAKEDLWKTETYYANAAQKRKDDIARKETADRNLTGITEVEISQFERVKMLQATEDAKKRIQRQKNKEDAADDEGEEWIDLGVKSDEALEIEKKKERMVAKAKGLGFRKFGKKKSG
ncbi:unnamed protein product [Bathycoccus prasinos]|tara:strand:- start:2526 stop:3500 length:975 start_codon:yes stop_codon:yes gene_type:complete